MDESRASQRDAAPYTRPDDPAFGPLGAQEVQHVEKRMARVFSIGALLFFLVVWFLASSPELRGKFLDEDTVVEQPVTSKIPVPEASTRRSVAIRGSAQTDATQDAFIDASQYGTNCKAVRQQATRNPRWKQNLSLTVPQEILGASIPVYQIQWFNGKWSKLYTTGDGDIDWKDNGPGKQRRVWSYFFDHNHRFVVCGTESQGVAAE